MSPKFRDLVLVSLLAPAALLLTLFDLDNTILRALLGLPLVLILPGYALTAALFPDDTLAGTDRVVFTLGLSLGSTILGGFVLNWLPWGLHPDSWVVLLTFLTLGGSIIAFARRYLLALSASPRTEPEADPPMHRSPIGLSVGHGMLFGLSTLVVVGAVVLARTEAAQHPPADVIQLWMLLDATADTPEVRLGINSFGAADGTFRLQLQQEGYILQEWPALEIMPGQRWETTVTLREQQSGDGPVEARLYRQGAPREIYRQVSLWPETEQ